MGFRRRTGIHDRLRTVVGGTATDSTPTVTLEQVAATSSPSFLKGKSIQSGSQARGNEHEESAQNGIEYSQRSQDFEGVSLADGEPLGSTRRRSEDHTTQKPSQELEEWLTAADTMNRLGLRSTSMSSSIWVRRLFMPARWHPPSAYPLCAGDRLRVCADRDSARYATVPLQCSG